MSFVDTEFADGNAVSFAFYTRVVDHPGTEKDRRGWRRSIKRTEARNVRNHVNAELAERERDQQGWQDMELYDYDAAMDIIEQQERVDGFENGFEPEHEDGWPYCPICGCYPCEMD
jgi:hypothetical protein